MAEENFGKELAALDFASMIGGPMVAVIDAQAQSAMSTLQFITSDVFFNSKTNELVTTEFKYDKPVTDELGTTSLVSQKITIPTLTLSPVPFIRVESLIIDFNVKLTSVNTKEKNTNTTTEAGASGGIIGGALTSWLSPVKFSGSITDRSTTKTTGNVSKDYSLQVTVRAVQDVMPGGLSKILTILEDVISSQASDSIKA